MLHRHKKEPSPGDSRSGRVPKQEVRTNQIYSYHASRAARPEEKRSLKKDDHADAQTHRKQSMRPKRLKAGLVMLGVLVVVLACLHLDSAQVKVVVVGDPKTKIFLNSVTTYQQAADKAFGGFFNSNKLTIDTAKIETSLRGQFPELQAVSISLPFIGDHPTVYIQPASAQLLFVASDKSVYLLDSTGRAIASGVQASTAATDLQLPTVTDQSGLTVQVGNIILPESSVAFITQVVGQMQAKGLHITSLTLPPDSDEMYLQLSGLGYYIKFDLQGDAREEAGSYLAVKGYLQSHSITPSQYVDVRVEGKAYYK